MSPLTLVYVLSCAIVLIIELRNTMALRSACPDSTVPVIGWPLFVLVLLGPITLLGMFANFVEDAAAIKEVK